MRHMARRPWVLGCIVLGCGSWAPELLQGEGTSAEAGAAGWAYEPDANGGGGRAGGARSSQSAGGWVALPGEPGGSDASLAGESGGALDEASAGDSAGGSDASCPDRVGGSCASARGGRQANTTGGRAGTEPTAGRGGAVGAGRSGGGGVGGAGRSTGGSMAVAGRAAAGGAGHGEGGVTNHAGTTGAAGSGALDSTAPVLWFSEYVEGSGSNKALEIQAGTDADLGDCELATYSNGLTTPRTLALSGTLSAGSVYVLCSSAVAGAPGTHCDRSTNLGFNGNDAVALSCLGAVLDVIGELGVDPGEGWTSGDVSTVNTTLRRRCGVEHGDPDGSDPFDPALEWGALPVDTLDGLGDPACF